ncbi:MAG: peptidase C15 [Hyphomicrobiales bacterium]|nr:peptidase C15 [Hyphomicrobiales bacterium]
MMTLLVTGFGAFPGAPRNPSADVALILARRFRSSFSRAGVRLATAVLPVVYAIEPHLDAIAAREKPDAIVHLGVAGQRRRVSVETRARNRRSIIRPDAQRRFSARLAHPGAASERRSGWNARLLCAALRRVRIDAVVSVDAGDYICNAALWSALAQNGPPAIFIHVPGARRLAPARMAEALARILPAAMLATTRRHCVRAGWR